MITIQGFPLLHEDECKEMFSSDATWSGYYFVKPVCTWLPDMKELEEEEKPTYLYKDLKEGLYLTGIEIIADRWVNKGFCGTILEIYGLVLDEANPIVKKGDGRSEKAMIYLSFKHIAFSVNSMKIKVSPNSH